ncbi:MAG: hypothetical protein HZA78_10585 [Candidatus Schekmanbacteria bacterium]|nr:hypothetical protein [Candidatus Schekmanbacteria bacterium]
MRGFDPNIPKDYIVEDERKLPSSEQTVFKIRNLTVREMEILKNSLFTKQGDVEKWLVGSQERQTLEMGLTSWENFRDQAGNAIPFSVQNLDYIPAKYRTELAYVIRGESEVCEDEIKN